MTPRPSWVGRLMYDFPLPPERHRRNDEATRTMKYFALTLALLVSLAGPAWAGPVGCEPSYKARGWLKKHHNVSDRATGAGHEAPRRPTI